MFYYEFNNNIKQVSKISKEDFTKNHIDCISQMSFCNQKLSFQNNEWHSTLLGAGEEKAVYCVCDQNNKVFALELIDENHYLNGRLIDGEYFSNITVNNIKRVKFNSTSLIGLQFTGLVKAREFVYGYEWGRFSFNPKSHHKFIDLVLTSHLQSIFLNEYKNFEKYYKDVHDRNIMFEINTEFKNYPYIFLKNYNNKIQYSSISLRAIDVR